VHRLLRRRRAAHCAARRAGPRRCVLRARRLHSSARARAASRRRFAQHALRERYLTPPPRATSALLAGRGKNVVSLYTAAFAALDVAASPSARAAALELLHDADVNALTVNDTADADMKDQSVWSARIAGSDRLSLEGIRAFKNSKGDGSYRYQMKRVVFGKAVHATCGMTVATFALKMELDCGSGRSETVTVTFTKQSA